MAWLAPSPRSGQVAWGLVEVFDRKDNEGMRAVSAEPRTYMWDLIL
jgi:hypothetical protein